MDIVVVCVFAIGVTGLFINSGFLKIRHRLLRWRSVH
jgi:ABC-type nitrate/sulfonate/bicarbonate transport system permease component